MSSTPLLQGLLEQLATRDGAAAAKALRSVPAAQAGAMAVALADEVPKRARVDLVQGGRLADAAMALARRARDPIVLARALKLVVEDRVFLSGNRTIIFD